MGSTTTAMFSLQALCSCGIYAAASEDLKAWISNISKKRYRDPIGNYSLFKAFFPAGQFMAGL
jgi:hypothetical protein